MAKKEKKRKNEVKVLFLLVAVLVVLNTLVILFFLSADSKQNTQSIPLQQIISHKQQQDVGKKTSQEEISETNSGWSVIDSEDEDERDDNGDESDEDDESTTDNTESSSGNEEGPKQLSVQNNKTDTGYDESDGGVTVSGSIGTGIISP